MKKIYGLLLLLVIFLIPNVYAEDKNIYELKMYLYEDKTDFEMSNLDNNALFFFSVEDLISEEWNNEEQETIYSYKGQKVFVKKYDSTTDTNFFKVKDYAEVESITYIFSDDDKYDASYYGLVNYDGIKMVLIEPTEFINNEECTSVCINKVKIEDKNSIIINKSAPIFEGLELNLDLNLVQVGDFIKYKVNIKNPTDKDYEIAAGDKFSDSNYIKYEYTFDNNDNVLKANTEKTMYITVRYNKEVPEAEFTNGKFEEDNKAVINLSNGEPTPVSPTEVEIPDTYTGISIFVVFGIIALAGYLSYNKISGKSLMILIIPIILIPVLVYAYEKLEVKVNTHIEVQISKNIIENRYYYSTNRDFWEYFDSIKTITFLKKIEEPNDYKYKYDVSDNKDNSVIAYLVENESNSEYYDLYIMANGKIYANPDSSNLFSDMEKLTKINNMEYFDTSLAIDMSYMFYNCNDLREIDLSHFNTFNVLNMRSMFEGNYYYNTLQALDLSSFDTSNVMDMTRMFSGLNKLGSLNLGNNFDTSKVTCMERMFYYTGGGSSTLSINLGNKFDTSNVRNMSYMFEGTGYGSTVFTLDLGDKFDTSNVTDMSHMFYYTGRSSETFELNLGDKFDTSNVTNMSYMFEGTGIYNDSLSLDLGSKFNTSKVVDMTRMFYGFQGKTIYVPTSFVTTNVVSSNNMFFDSTKLVGGAGTVYDSSHIDASYAHIDGGPSNPGYFTLRTEG